MEVATKQSKGLVLREEDKAKLILVPTDLDDAKEKAEIMASSSLVPAAYKGKVNDVIIAVQYGQEVGLKPLQAVQSICVINGTPSIWGQGLMGLILASPVCEYMILDFNEAENKAYCRTQRAEHPEEQVFTFSWDDAIRAKLETKDTYKKFPQNMLRWRALSLAAKFLYADVTKGLVVGEEAQDYPEPSASAERVDRINERLSKARAERDAKIVDVDFEILPDEAPDEAQDSAETVDAPDTENVEEATEEAPTTIQAPPPVKTHADESRELQDKMKRHALAMASWQERAAQLIMADPELNFQDMDRRATRKVLKAVTLMGGLIIGGDLRPFIKYAAEGGIYLDAAKIIKEQVEKFKASTKTDSDASGE